MIEVVIVKCSQPCVDWQAAAVDESVLSRRHYKSHETTLVIVAAKRHPRLLAAWRHITLLPALTPCTCTSSSSGIVTPRDITNSQVLDERPASLMLLCSRAPEAVWQVWRPPYQSKIWYGDAIPIKSKAANLFIIYNKSRIKTSAFLYASEPWAVTEVAKIQSTRTGLK